MNNLGPAGNGSRPSRLLTIQLRRAILQPMLSWFGVSDMNAIFPDFSSCFGNSPPCNLTCLDLSAGKGLMPKWQTEGPTLSSQLLRL